MKAVSEPIRKLQKNRISNDKRVYVVFGSTNLYHLDQNFNFSDLRKRQALSSLRTYVECSPLAFKDAETTTSDDYSPKTFLKKSIQIIVTGRRILRNYRGTYALLSNHFSSAKSSYSEETESMVRKVFSFSSLAENWDEHGARPISTIAISKAVHLIRYLDRKFDIYFINPTVNGGVGLEIRKKDKSKRIILEICQTGTINFHKILNSKTYQKGVLDLLTGLHFFEWINE